MVARCPGMGTELDLCGVFRHRLDAPAAQAAGQGAGALSGRSLWHRARIRRARAALRFRHGQLQRLVSRTSLSRAAARLCHCPPALSGESGVERRYERRAAGTDRAAGGGVRSPAPSEPQAARGGTRAGEPAEARARRALRRRPGSGRSCRRRDRAHERHRRRPQELSPAARPARAPVVSPGLLARRRRRDQLPALLQHQRAGRHPHRERHAVRADPPAGRPVDRRGQAAWPAARSCRRPVRPRDLLPAPAGLCRQGARGHDNRRRDAAVLHRRREDPGPPREPQGILADFRHHRLRIHQPGQRPVRRPGRPTRAGARLPAEHRARGPVRGNARRGEEPGHR